MMPQYIVCLSVRSVQFSSIQLLDLCFTQSYNKNYDSFQPASDVVLISGGRLFHADGPATEKLRGPKPVVLVRGTTRSP